MTDGAFRSTSPEAASGQPSPLLADPEILCTPKETVTENPYQRRDCFVVSRERFYSTTINTTTQFPSKTFSKSHQRTRATKQRVKLCDFRPKIHVCDSEGSPPNPYKRYIPIFPLHL